MTFKHKFKKMRLLTILFIFLITISCKEEKPKKVSDINNPTSKVQHYICDNKCENSGGDTAGNCPVCNTPYTHNQAFHNSDFLKNGPLKVPENNQNSTTNTPAAPSPAQNSQGVYHYTCANSCYGGSGTASKCNSCGETLIHNSAYHN